MFLGHFGVGFAAKPLAPRASLGALFLAAQFLDLLWPTLLLLEVERVAIAPGITAVTPLDFTHYPWSHSLLMVVLWGALFALAYRAVAGDRRAALVAFGLVVSHWLLDAVMHRPDLPLWPGASPLVGLGAWGSLPLALAIELPLFAAGVWLYARATVARDAAGRWGLIGLVAFLLLIQLGNARGEPPPSVAAIAWVGQAQWLLVLWGGWLDRHRAARGV
jgi:hypothetical protein